MSQGNHDGFSLVEELRPYTNTLLEFVKCKNILRWTGERQLTYRLGQSEASPYGFSLGVVDSSIIEKNYEMSIRFFSKWKHRWEPCKNIHRGVYAY